MNKKKYKNMALSMLQLIRCYVDNKQPDSNIIENLDVEELYIVAKDHSLLGLTSVALENIGIINEKFIDAENKLIRKEILYDNERNSIIKQLENNNIKHLELKGIVLKEYYPKIGTRQMSDNDILIEKEKASKVKKIMINQGYKVKSFGTSYDDVYYKENLYNIEIHKELFSEIKEKPRILKYYNKFKDKIKLKKGNSNEMIFTKEDFYIYMIAHEYKHYIKGGIGLRAFVDMFFYLRKEEENLNWSYITNELMKMNLLEFENRNYALMKKIFRGIKIDENEQKELNYYIFSGTYGNIENFVDNSLKNKSKVQYIVNRLVPSKNTMKIYHPFFFKTKIFIPVLVIARLFRVLIFKRKNVKNEIEYLLKK